MKISRLLYIIVTLLLFSMQGFAQSEYGGFRVMSKKAGLPYADINDIYEDSKGFMWFATSEGLMRYDGVDFDIYSNVLENGGATSGSVRCMFEDKYTYAMWIGTTLGYVCKIDVESGQTKRYSIKNAKNLVNQNAYIVHITQINDSLLLLGTMKQGFFYFSPETETFKKVSDPTLMRVQDNGVKENRSVNRIYESDERNWGVTNYGFGYFNSTGLFDKAYYFDGTKIGEDYTVNKVPINDLVEVNSDSLLFLTNKGLYSYSLSSKLTKIIYKGPKDVNLTELCLDGHGGIWLGTKGEGVIFYNSNTKIDKLFTSGGRKDEGEIPSNEITRIIKSKDQDIIWIGTRRGFSCYNYNRNKFKTFDFSQDIVVGNNVNNAYFLHKDKGGGYWFSNLSGLYYKSSSDNKFKLCTKETGLPNSAFEDTIGNVWFATRVGLYKYNTKTNKGCFIKLSNDDPKVEYHLNFMMRTIQSDDKDFMWIGTSAGLVNFNMYTNKFRLFPFPIPDDGGKNIFTFLTYDNSKKTIWIGERKGNIYKFNLTNYRYIKTNFNEGAEGISQSAYNLLSACMVDDDRLWVATHGKGLLEYNMKNDFVSSPFSIEVLSGNIFAIQKDAKDNVWMTTTRGLTRINTVNNEVEIYNEADGVICDEFHENSVAKSINGNFLFGGSGGFVEFDPVNVYINKYNAPCFVKSWTIDKGDKTRNIHSRELIYKNIDDQKIDFTYGQGSVFLNVAVLDYSHPNLNSFKWRIAGYVDDWQTYKIGTPISLGNISPGKFKLELVGINSDNYEMPIVSICEINVEPRFTQTVFFYVLVSLFVLSIAWFIYYSNVKIHKRRQERLKADLKVKVEEIEQMNDIIEVLGREIKESHVSLKELKTAESGESLIDALELDKSQLSSRLQKNISERLLQELDNDLIDPLTAIVSFLNLLTDTKTSQDDIKELATLVHNDGLSLLDIVNSRIQIYQLESGQYNFEYRSLPIRTLISDVCLLVINDNRNNIGLSVDINVVPFGLMLNIDVTRTKILLVDIVRNAIELSKVGFVTMHVYKEKVSNLMDMGFEVDYQNDDYSDDDVYEVFIKVRFKLSNEYKNTDVPFVIHSLQGNILAQYDKVTEGLADVEKRLFSDFAQLRYMDDNGGFSEFQVLIKQ